LFEQSPITRRKGLPFPTHKKKQKQKEKFKLKPPKTILRKPKEGKKKTNKGKIEINNIFKNYRKKSKKKE
jgi:hypothetical protein